MHTRCCFFFFWSLFRISCLVSLSILTYLLTLPRLFTASFFCFFFFFLLSSSSSMKQQKRSQKLKGFGLIAVSSHFRLLSDWWRNQSLMKKTAWKSHATCDALIGLFFAVAIWLSSFSLKSCAQTWFRYLVVNKRSSAPVRTRRRSLFTPFIFVSFPVCRFSLYPQSSCPALSLSRRQTDRQTDRRSRNLPSSSFQEFSGGWWWVAFFLTQQVIA